MERERRRKQRKEADDEVDRLKQYRQAGPLKVDRQVSKKRAG